MKDQANQVRKKVPAPAERDIRQAAFAAADLAAAGVQLCVADLQAVLDRSPRLAAAWERGRLLRQVQEVATYSPLVPEAADRELQWPRGTLVKLMARDRIVRGIWREARHQALMKVQRGVFARAQAGDPAAVKAYERLMEHAEPVAAADFNRLTQTQLVEALGYPRQTLLRWEADNGLPRNGDKTYSLPRIIEWLLQWERDKITGGKETQGLNPMQAEKARMYKLQADEAENRLIDRATILRLFRERAARMVQLLGEATADRWSHAHEGQTAAQLKPMYIAAFRQVWTLWEEFPPEVPLPPEARARIEEGIGLLLKEETTNDHK
jgi:hypothetical protein